MFYLKPIREILITLVAFSLKRNPSLAEHSCKILTNRVKFAVIKKKCLATFRI